MARPGWLDLSVLSNVALLGWLDLADLSNLIRPDWLDLVAPSAWVHPGWLDLDAPNALARLGWLDFGSLELSHLPLLAQSGCPVRLGWLNLAALVAPGRFCWLDLGARGALACPDLLNLAALKSLAPRLWPNTSTNKSPNAELLPCLLRESCNVQPASIPHALSQASNNHVFIIC